MLDRLACRTARRVEGFFITVMSSSSYVIVVKAPVDETAFTGRKVFGSYQEVETSPFASVDEVTSPVSKE